MMRPTITLLRALVLHPKRIAFICGVCWREVRKWIRRTRDKALHDAELYNDPGCKGCKEEEEEEG